MIKNNIGEDYLNTFSLTINDAIKLNIIVDNGFLLQREWDIIRQPQMHMHTYFEAFFVKKGAIIINTPTEKILIKENDFCCIRPGELHSTKPADSEESLQCERISILFEFREAEKSKKKDKSIAIFTNSPFVLIKQNEKIKNIVDHLLQSAGEFSKPYNEYEKNILSFIIGDLIYSVLRISSQTIEYENGGTQYSSVETRKYLINQYISLHYTDDISLENLSKKFFLTKKQIINTIKRMTGMTFRQYVIYLRLVQAESLIVNTDNEISKIAHLVGYNSENGFYQAFKKKYGVTPDMYRKKIRK